jgi:hypothetical protein
MPQRYALKYALCSHGYRNVGEEVSQSTTVINQVFPDVKKKRKLAQAISSKSDEKKGREKNNLEGLAADCHIESRHPEQKRDASERHN